MAKKYTDITKTGPLYYKKLQEENGLSSEEVQKLQNFDNSLTDTSDFQGNPYLDSPQLMSSSVSRTKTPFGKSFFDPESLNDEEVTRIGDIRAKNEPTVLKWLNGIGKGAVLAGTTFLDGVFGLAYGTADAIANIPNKNESGWKTLSRIFDNEVSNGLQEINNFAEEWMPNYRTDVETENPWYNNIFTANFIADNLLKNMGFMVGAYYSGGAWNKLLNGAVKGARALKGMNATKHFAEAYRDAKNISTLGARINGSLLSAVNEARIESNNLINDTRNLERAKLEDGFKREYEEIINSNLSIEPSVEGGVSPKQQALDNLKNKYKELYKNIDENAAKAGLINLAIQAPFLMFDDFMLYGKLYSRGFSNSADVAKQITEGTAKKGILGRIHEAGKRGLKSEAQEASRIAKEGGKYVANKITKGETWRKVLTTGVREGNEEMFQQFSQSYSGALYETDGPDAYYKALTNPRYNIETRNVMESIVEGFNKSYGDGEQWEQFAVGAISALLGMPTFGKANNSDANTVLGRGKTIGWSNGILGEFSSARAINREAEVNVKAMNKLMDNVEDYKKRIIMSKAMSDAMDGFSVEGNKFEFKNASDTDMFNILQAFSNSGRIDDLKDMLDVDYDNMSDEEIAKYAAFNSQTDKDGNIIGGFTDKTGRPYVTIDDEGNMYITPEDADEVRKILNKREGEVRSKLEAFDNAVQAVRGGGNNSLSKDQEAELAWLYWKYDAFKNRLHDILEDKNNIDLWDVITSQLDAQIRDYDTEAQEIQEWIDHVKSIADIAAEDKDKLEEHRRILEENKDVQKNIKSIREIFEALKSPSNEAFLANLFKKNKEFANIINSKEFFEFVADYGDNMGFHYEDYKNAMQNFIDAIRLTNAMVDFNNRYKEFMSDPTALAKNRKKIDDKNKETEEAINKGNLKSKVRDTKVSDLTEMSDDELSNLEDELNSAEDKDGINKVAEARKMKELESKTLEELTKMLNDGKITRAEYEAVLAKFKNMKEKSENVDQLSDLESFAAQESIDIDPADLEEFQRNNPNTDLQEQARQILDEAMSAAKSGIAGKTATPKDTTSKAKEEFKTNEEDKSKDPKPVEPTSSASRDPSTKVTSETERARKEAEEKEKDKKKEEISKVVKSYTDDVMLNLGYIINNVTPEERTDIEKRVQHIITEALNRINSLKDSGNPILMEDVIPVIMGLDDRNYLVNKYGDIMLKAIGNTILTIINDAIQDAAAEEASKKQTEVEHEDPMYDNTTDSDNNNYEEDINNQLSNESQYSSSEVLNYWKPTTSEVAHSRDSKSLKPYWKVLEDKKQPYEKYKKLWEYLKNKNAFENSYEVKEGDEVRFIIDPSLNNDVGMPVILMTVNGKVIGDLGLPTDGNFNNIRGLSEFYNTTVEAFNKWQAEGNSGVYEVPGAKSTVAKKMVGKAPFIERSKASTLNEIHSIETVTGETQAPFKLAVTLDGNVVMSGNKRSAGLSPEDMRIMQPLSESKRNGKPYLLLPTGSSTRAYSCVPFTMTPFSARSTSKIAGLVKETINNISALKKGDEVSFIRQLQELLQIPKMGMDINADGTINIHFTKLSGDKISSKNMSRETAINFLLQKIENVPYNVSRKYINGKYKGYDYNLLIGEVATVNLPKGTTHVVSTWYIVNPIVNGVETKAKSPKSKKEDPYKTSSVSSKSVTFIYKSQTKGQITVTVTKNDDGDIVVHCKSEDGKGGDVATNTNLYKEYRARYLIQVNNIQPKDKKYVAQKDGKIIEGTFYQIDDKFFNSETGKFYNSLVDRTTLETPSTETPGISSEDLNNFSAASAERGTPVAEFGNTTVSTTNNTTAENTLSKENKEAIEKAKKKCVSPINQKIFEALSDEQKIALGKVPNIKFNTVMSQLKNIFDSKAEKFKDDTKIDDIINPKRNREVTRESYSVRMKKMRKKELDFVNKLFPNMRQQGQIRLVDGLIKIGDNKEAWGQFYNGVITLSRDAASGTGYHEAFHAVVHTLLSNEETNTLFKAAENKFGTMDNISLEEKLAEDFRNYMELQEMPIIGGVVKLFRSLKHILQNLFGKEPYLNNLYYRISRNKIENKLRESDIYYENEIEQPNVYISFNSNQIKSATGNVGTFSRTDNNIYKEHESVNYNYRRDVRLQTLINKELPLKHALRLLEDSDYKDILNVLNNAFKEASLFEGVTIKIISPLSEFSNAVRVREQFNDRRAYYDSSSNTIVINADAEFRQGDVSSVLMHELMHAATINRLNSNPKLRAEFEELVKQYRKYYPSEYFRLSDKHYLEEFVADIWSNPETIEKLKRTPYKGNPKRSLWARFINFITTKLFSGYIKNSMFEEASNALLQLLTETTMTKTSGRFFENENHTTIKSEYRGKLILDYTKFNPISQEELYRRKFEQHYRDKYMYGALNKEDRQYIEDRGISIEEYNNMSTEEKETLFKCKI